MVKKMKVNIILTLFIGVILAQEFTADEIIRKVELAPKPNTSITEVKLEITRFKRGKEKIKIREFSRFQKFYKSGKFKSKSIIRFHEPKIVKGAGLLSWSRKNGDTDQWIFLPKLKAAKQVKAKEKSKKFMGTDFRYEDLENRKQGQDSVVIIGNEYFQGSQCKGLMAYPKDESIYFSRKIWIDTFNWNIQKIEFYLTELKKEKTLTFSEFITVDKYMTPGILTMDIEDEINKTILIIKSFKPNIVLKGTRVDGVYSSDPEKNKDAIKFEELSFNEAYEKNLNIMDMTAFTLCKENSLPIIVFDMNKPGNLSNLIEGKKIGTLIY